MHTVSVASQLPQNLLSATVAWRGYQAGGHPALLNLENSTTDFTQCRQQAPYRKEAMTDWHAHQVLQAVTLLNHWLVTYSCTKIRIELSSRVQE